jgi:CubicO group peptidase (beta-lactamase class C family)
VTGRPFAAALQDYILSPAGMSTAVLNGNSADELAHRAASYYPKEEGGIEPRAYDFPPFLTTAAGLNASLDDMIAFARALERGTLLDDLWKQAMWRVPMLNNGERSSYALGWDRREVGKGQATFGHEGGSLTTFRVYPHAGLSIIVLTNGLHSYFGLDGFADALALAVEPDILDPADAIAYRGKMLYARDGIDGTDRFLREALQTTAISDADGESIVLWLADELADSGRSGDAVRLLTSGIDAMPDSAALKTEREKLGSAAH